MPFLEHKNQNRTHGRTRYRFYLQHNNKKYRNTVVVYRTTVERVYHEWVRSIMDGTIVNRDRKLFEIIDLYLAYIAERKPEKYFKLHRKELTLFGQFFRDIHEDVKVIEIKRAHMKDFKEWRRKHSLVLHKREISVRAVNESVSVLSVFFNWCIDREYYTRSNPASRCKDSEDNFRLVILNPAQIAELLSKAKDCKDGWLYTGVVLALFAGLRKKEVLELQWGDIDPYQGVINLRAVATKSKKQRTIPLPGFLENHLSGIEREGEWVLMDHGTRVRADRFWYKWERFRDSLSFATLPNGLTLTFHDLRHVYAQSLRDAGVNLGDIQAYMGHSSVELTIRRYAQRGGEDGRAKVDRLTEVYHVH